MIYNGFMPKSEYSVIIPKDVFPKPNKKEMSAAYILLEYFKTDIKFIPRNNCKTPDLFIMGVKNSYRQWQI